LLFLQSGEAVPVLSGITNVSRRELPLSRLMHLGNRIPKRSGTTRNYDPAPLAAPVQLFPFFRDNSGVFIRALRSSKQRAQKNCGAKFSKRKSLNFNFESHNIMNILYNLQLSDIAAGNGNNARAIITAAVQYSQRDFCEHDELW